MKKTFLILAAVAALGLLVVACSGVNPMAPIMGGGNMGLQGSLCPSSSCTDMYSVAETTFSWIDATGGTGLSLGDDDAQLIPIGFTFSFYGQDWTDLYVESNGYLSFGDYEESYDYCIPSGFGQPTINVLQDDLNPNYGGEIRYLLEGEAPNRRLTVAWLGIFHYDDPPAPFTFAATLFEGSNSILMQYLNLDAGDSDYNNGAAGAVGVENADGSVYTQYSCDSAVLASGFALLFCPACS